MKLDLCVTNLCNSRTEYFTAYISDINTEELNIDMQNLTLSISNKCTFSSLVRISHRSALDFKRESSLKENLFKITSKNYSKIYYKLCIPTALMDPES